MQIPTKTFVVTGADSGIGRELTLQLLSRGPMWLGGGKDAKFLDWLYRLNPRYATHFIQKKIKSRRSA